MTHPMHITPEFGLAAICVYFAIGIAIGRGAHFVSKLRGMYRPGDRAIYAFFAWLILGLGWLCRVAEFAYVFNSHLRDGYWPYTWCVSEALGLMLGFSWTGQDEPLLLDPPTHIRKGSELVRAQTDSADAEDLR